jgi:hypothetical protein
LTFDDVVLEKASLGIAGINNADAIPFKIIRRVTMYISLYIYCHSEASYSCGTRYLTILNCFAVVVVTLVLSSSTSQDFVNAHNIAVIKKYYSQ